MIDLGVVVAAIRPILCSQSLKIAPRVDHLPLARSKTLLGLIVQDCCAGVRQSSPALIGPFFIAL